MARPAAGKGSGVTIEARDSLLAGRYRIGGRLGTGGAGTVLRAHDERLNRPVAIKVLHAGSASPIDQSRFRREARTAARVDHPNIVKIFDVDTVDGDLFIVMELCAGPTLAARISQQPLSTDQVRALALPLLDALACAHAAGIVHRDIKPSNILFTQAGSPKLADFGIAQILDEIDGRTMVTDTGHVIGTAAYLAPERLAGEPATVQTDLYALGAALYEALAGRPPYDGPNVLAVARAMTAARPDPLPVPRSPADRQLSAAIERALQPEPKARFLSAVDMAAALQAAATSAADPAGHTALPTTEPIATMAMPTAFVPPHEPAAETEQHGTPSDARSHGTAGWSRSRGFRIALATILALLIAVAGALAVARAGTGDESPPSTSTTVPTTAAPTTTTLPAPPPSTAPAPPATGQPPSSEGAGSKGPGPKDRDENGKGSDKGDG